MIDKPVNLVELDAFKCQEKQYKMYIGQLVNETSWCETETFDFQSETETFPHFHKTETRPRRLKLRLETVSRPRRQDRDHIPGMYLV